jgi:hypothetical protein
MVTVREEGALGLLEVEETVLSGELPAALVARTRYW